MPAPDAVADTLLLAAAVREAGAIARTYFGGSFKTWRKSDGNPVTDADIAVDRYLRTSLLAARPDYGWLSEESAEDPSRLQKTRTFVVDPIDGTHGFLKGRPQFTIVAAVVEAGRPVSACVYNPITEELYDAVHRGGARCNGTGIQVRTAADFSSARFLVTKAFLDPADWTSPWPAAVTAETRASIAYRMALIAEGKFDVMVSLSEKSDWDLAAGDLIAQEAGALVTDGEGRLLSYNGAVPRQGSVVCAPPELHRRMLARLKDRVKP